MNIQVQCCGLVLMLLLLYFYTSQKSVGLYSGKFFRKTLTICIISICLDILSVAAIVYSSFLPLWLLSFICKSYVISLVWIGYLSLLYISLDLYPLATYQKVHRFYSACIVIATIVVYCLPIRYYHEGSVVYTYGASITMTYVFAVTFVLITFYNIIRFRSQINPKKREAVILWLAMWMLASALQFLNNEWLLIGYASSLGMLILFLKLENPAAYLDRSTGFFHSHVLLAYMKQRYESGQPFCALVLSLEQRHKNSANTSQIDAAMDDAVQYLQSMPDGKIFKSVERELVLLFDTQEKMYESFHKIQEHFQGMWEKELQILYLLFPDSAVAEDEEEAFDLFKYYKQQNRHRSEDGVICIDEDLAAKKREREQMEHTILSAMEDDRIEVFYQPIYSTAKKQFVSAEALVRIRSKDGGLVPPGSFISVAEETGLILRLGEIVFEKTCRFLKDNRLEDYGIEYIEVNLSVTQCQHPNLAGVYMGIMEQYGLEPSRINLEITESASIHARQTLLENMHALMDYGVSFSLDDFGNGQSNLNYIVDMPVAIVKFDRDMTQAYFENQKARFVMSAAMHMIHDMELKVVSEGVETKEQLEVMAELGIDYIQGYYFSKPLPGQEFLEYIKKNNA